MATTITYNSTSLNDGTTYTTNTVDDSRAHERRLKTYDLARAHGVKLADDTFGKKTITVAGKIYGTSVDNLESNIDSFNALMATRDKNLDIGYAGGTRRYIVTPNRFMVSRPVRAAAWANFEVDFESYEFGRDTSSTTAYNGTITSTVTPFSLGTIGGSAPTQLMVITLTLTTVTPDASNYVSFTNSDTADMLTITRTWVAGDVIAIDNATRSVTVNGSVAAFTGPFIEYEPGSGTLDIDHDFTGSISWGLNVVYTKRWL